MKSFRIGEALRFGWEIFKKHFLFLWMILGITWGISVLLSLLEKGAGQGSLIGLLVGVGSIIVGFILQLGLIRMYLSLVDGTEEKLAVLFSQYHLVWRYLGAAILYWGMIVIGLTLFIVPGIYFALKYQFFSYLIVDKNLGVIDALKESGVMTQGVKWKLMGFSLMLCGLNILGMLALGVGLFVTIPMSVMAYVFVYRALATREQKAVTNIQ